MPGLILDAEGAVVARWEARRGRLGSLSGAAGAVAARSLVQTPRRLLGP